MIIGVPKEIKVGEYRVAMTPEGVRIMTRAGHSVRVQKGAGEGAGFSDTEYRRAGAAMVSGASGAWSAELVIKVKEPSQREHRFFRPHQALFAFLHLAPNRPLTQALLRKKVIAIAYETVEDESGHLPILRSMSEIAGRIAALMGNYFQGNPQGGRGVLYSGATGVPPAQVVILGGGVVGQNAARIASHAGSRVVILERFPERIRFLKKILPASVMILKADPGAVRRAVISADILIGALHIPGAKTPRLVTRGLVRRMKRRSVIIDVAIDQGGTCETSRPTSHLNPVYIEEGVIHYCVPNMPGAYARTSTLALTHITLPYIASLARAGIPGFLKLRSLVPGVQCYKGHLTCEPVAQAHRLHYARLATAVQQSKD
ncbi:MAG: alanine dehydrogenase [Elusimicrobia bacterium RIFCSPLOWO2_01_FULL_59_12]|nr:MAG: alanine dehydrogenase [Elusimicrobia bacterium RIFCSPLOWO2_01_FULL_59_12]